jgi:uncharacterized protein YacL
MNFLNVLYFVCLSMSFSVMWSFSEIFRPVRNIISRIPYIRRALICPECSSFWIGLLVSFLYNPIILDFNIIFVNNVICGLITHLFAFFLYGKKSIDKSIEFINI